MDTKTVIRIALEGGFMTLDAMMGDVTPDILHWTPPGTAQRVAASYAHVLVATDWQVHGMLQQKQGLWETTWAGKTGISPVSPMITPEWGKTVQVDLAQARQYEAAVKEALWAYVDSVNDFGALVDLSAMGFGQQSLAWILLTLVAAHCATLAGDISAIKGVQGVKGSPF